MVILDSVESRALCSSDMGVNKCELLKFEGLGNDFLIAFVHRRDMSVEPSHVRAILDRRRGAGADGLILSALIETATGPGLSMLLYNADGSQAQMSGNGIRCLAHCAVMSGVITASHFTVETEAGPRSIALGDLISSEVMEIEVSMGKVAYRSAAFALRQEFSGIDFVGTELDTGNPHLVFVARSQLESDSTLDLEALDLDFEGPLVEARYPDGTNIEWLNLNREQGTAQLRVWERGVGITQACGTGSTASAFLLLDQGLMKGEIEIVNPGGTLRLRQDLANGEMLLIGESRFVAAITPSKELSIASAL